MPSLPDDVELRLVTCLDDAMDMKRWLGERHENNTLGLDCETSGLSPYVPGARIRMIQIGDTHTGWAVPYTEWGGVALECLNDWEGYLTGHNLSFDVHWLEIFTRWKAPWERIHDSMIMGQIERPNMPNGLKAISDEFIDPLASQGEKKLKKAFKDNGWDWNTVPIDYPDYYIYSALDPILAAHAAKHFNYGQNFPVSYDLEMSVLRICNKMERNGMRVDLGYSQQKYDELTERAEKAKKWAKDNWGISVTSTQQLVAFFSDVLGAEFKRFSKKTGNPSIDKNQLAMFTESDNQMVAQVANFITEIRNIEKISGSYFKNFLEMNNDGVLHPTIRTLQAATGRMSITDPALQTIPSKDSLVRGAFIPDNEDQLIVSSDYSQVELRLLSHFAQDDALQQAFRNADATGDDFFTGLGKQIYQNDNFTKEDPRRKLVKSTMYGLIFGAGTAKMAQTAGIRVEEMEPVVDSVHKAFPGIKRFMHQIETVGEQRIKDDGHGYIYTGTGKKLYCEDNKVYSLLNYTLQGNAAEALKKAVVRLDAAGFSDYMKVPIHDEIVFSLPKDMIAESLPEIGEIMSYNNGEYAIDLPAEPEIAGENWGMKYA